MQQDKLFSTPQEELTSDDWYTPRWIFDKLQLIFDLDVCAPPGGVDWIPAGRFLTQAEDGLLTKWTGRVWMNPPFSNPLPWVIKFVEHGDGVALVPTSNGRWQDILWRSEAQWVTLPAIRFESPTKGLAKGTLPNRCWLVGFGVEKALERIGKVR